jgi:hypothetical protein
VRGPHGRSGGVTSYARAEWRAHGRSHVLIGLLVVVTVAATVAALVAAARSRTAFDRLREATEASDVMYPIEGGDPSALVAQLRRVDGVIDGRALSELFVRPEGSDLMPTRTSTAIAPRHDDPSESVDTPIITDGRAPDPARVDEVALSARLARDLGVGPGDDVHLESLTEAWVDASNSGTDPGPADGPRITATVTGIARSPAEFNRSPSVIHLTPAFVDELDGQLMRMDAIHLRMEPEALQQLRDGEVTLPIVSNDLPSLFDDLEATQDGLGTVATALRLVGLVAGVAGALTIALTLTRATRSSLRDRSTLRALGWTRPDEAKGVALAFAPALAVGVVVGVAIGLLASPRALVGLAGAIDPRGKDVLADPLLVVTVVGIALALAGSLLLAVAVLAVRRSTHRRARAVGLPLGRPLALHLAVRHAVAAPTDRGGRANRGAILAVAGATAVGIAALAVSSSIERLQVDPSLTGERPERVIDMPDSTDAFDEVVDRLEADERVSVLAAQHVSFGFLVGLGELELLITDARRGELATSVTAGRAPRTSEEVALGPEIVDLLGKGIGDEVELVGPDGSATYEVVGTVLFPEGDFSHDEGAALTIEGADRIVDDLRNAPDAIHQVVFDWADPVDVSAADAELEADGLAVLEVGSGLRATPGNVTNLARVAHLPRQLAGLVVLLALVTLLHAAWTGVALRSAELTTLQAIGVTKRTVALLVALTTITIAAVGLLVGAPFGFAMGRQVWESIASNAHLVARTAVRWPWAATFGGVLVVAGLGVAALAARWTRRLDPATTLRVE